MQARKWWVLTSVGLMMFLLNVDLTAVNLALAEIARAFHTDMSTIQWVINGYQLSTASLMMVSGRLGDMFGRRKIFFIGTAIFALASFITGFADVVSVVILGRVLQGVGMALAFPQIIALASLSFPKERQGFVMGIIISIAGVSQAIGPTFGGYVLHFLNWRWLFYINFPVAIIAVMIGWFAIRESHEDEDGEHFDYFGASALALSLMLLIFGLNQIHHWGFVSVGVLGSILASLALMYAFVMIDRRVSNPLVDMQVFFKRDFVLAMLSRAFAIYSFSTILLVMGLCLQNVLNYSVQHAGEIFLAMTIVFGALSIVIGRLVDRFGAKYFIAVGGLFLAMSLYLFSKIQLISSLTYILLAFVLSGIGIGLNFTSTLAKAMNSVSEHKVGTASGVFYTFVFLSFSIGIAIAGALLVSVGHHSFSYWLSQTDLHFTAIQQQTLAGIYSGTRSAQNFTAHIPQRALHAAQVAFLAGLRRVMETAGVIGGLSVITGLAMTAWKKRDPIE